MIAGYAQQLAASGGRLYPSGVEPEMVGQFHHARVKGNAGTIKIFQANEVLGESTIEAVADARTWLVGEGAEPRCGDRSAPGARLASGDRAHQPNEPFLTLSAPAR